MVGVVVGAVVVVVLTVEQQARASAVSVWAVGLDVVVVAAAAVE